MYPSMAVMLCLDRARCTFVPLLWRASIASRLHGASKSIKPTIAPAAAGFLQLHRRCRQVVASIVKKQEKTEQDGNSKQANKDRVKGDLDPNSGIWNVRDSAKLRATLTENKLRFISQRVAPDRANKGLMSDPGLVSSIGAARFARPTWEPCAASPAVDASTPRSRSCLASHR
jgi:hypothetical protein